MDDERHALAPTTGRDLRRGRRWASVPVLIVAGGPAGSRASPLLALFGVESMTIERRVQPSILPRSAGADLRTWEIFRGLSPRGDLEAASAPPAGVPLLVVVRVAHSATGTKEHRCRNSA
jgi:hypothetical protein